MNLAALIIIIIAIILALTGGLMEGLMWLLWVGVALAIVAIIMFLLRAISGRSPRA